MTQSLAGKRVVVTRSLKQAEAMCQKLEALGATAVRFPVIDFAPLPTPNLENELACCHWLVFTSVNAVDFFLGRLETGDWKLENWNTHHAPRTTHCTSLKIAAVGPATAQRLQGKGIFVDFVPSVFMGEQLALELPHVAGQRVLLARPRDGRPEISAILQQRGAVVAELPLYETVTAVPPPDAIRQLTRGVDVLTFTSPSTVRSFCQMVTVCSDKPRPVVACIGSTTVTEAQKWGLMVAVIAEEQTVAGLITAVAHYFEREFVRS